MALHNLGTSTNQNNFYDSGSEETPQLLRLMLQNVYLNPEKTCPPLEQSGEFWYWLLSYYALELMRALLRSSSAAFSYPVTFMETEPEMIPQIVLLRQLNLGIHNQLKGKDCRETWTSILNSSPYLRVKAVSIDAVVFQDEIGKLVQRVQQGVFEQSGDRRIYASVRELVSP